MKIALAETTPDQAARIDSAAISVNYSLIPVIISLAMQWLMDKRFGES